jgi:hypothetical protein
LLCNLTGTVNIIVSMLIFDAQASLIVYLARTRRNKIVLSNVNIDILSRLA